MTVFLILVVAAGLLVSQSLAAAGAVSKSRRNRNDGNVGCLLSQKLCRKHEFCFDDFAFGRCLWIRRASNEPDRAEDIELDFAHRYRYILDKDALRQLEQEFRRLFLAGYRWAHSYTQCIVKRLLDSFRRRTVFERSECVGKEDDDLARALQFLEAEHKVDPRDLAIVRFQPSLLDPQTDYGDEMYAPSSMDSDNFESDPVGVESDALEYLRDVAVADDEEDRAAVSDDAFVGDSRVDPFRRKFKRKQPTLDVAELSEQELEELESLILARYFENEELGSELLDPDLERRSDRSFNKDSDDDEPTWSFAKHKGRNAVRAGSMNFDESLDTMLKKSYKDPNESADPEDKIEIDDEDRDHLLTYLTGLMRLDPTVAFERPHRYDVKKPGPYFKVNNYGFDKEDDGDRVDHISREPVFFKQHPMFEESDPAEATFRRHHLVDGETSQPTNADLDIEFNEKDEMKRAQALDDIRAALDGVESLDYPSESSDYELALDYGEDPRLVMTNENQFPEYAVDFDDDDHRRDDVSVYPPPMDDYEAVKLKPYYVDSVFEEQRQRFGADVRRAMNKLRRKNGEIPTTALDMIERSSPITDADRVIISKNDRPTEGVQAPFKEHTNGADRVPSKPTSADPGEFDVVDTSCVYLVVDKSFKDWPDSDHFVRTLEALLGFPSGTFSNVVRQSPNRVLFKVNSNQVNGSIVANKAEILRDKLLLKTGFLLTSAGIGDKTQIAVEALENDNRMFVVTFIVCGVIAGAVIAVGALYVVRRHARSREKLQGLAQLDTEASHDYQDLCRQRMASKSSEKPEPIHVAQRVMSKESETSVRSSSSRSSTSSWNEEPVISNMDISTGHMVLSYMEDHLNNKDRLEQEWIALCAYEADPASVEAATDPANIKKNRYEDVLPYDHSRVVLNDETNIAGSDYINASTIADHDPRNPAYIACQGPLPHTSADFWQMVWEQGSVVIVMLTRLVENGVAMCHRYWPEEGSELYHIYEVHLVSEHIWCEDYLVRSFYLKNLKTGETRTVTQFHFLSWSDNGVPSATKALLDYRRKVNKSYRGRSCPIVVHCSDGIGRTGTYCLIDMVLNRMAKGAKEIDIAATLEHIRDQRTGMVRAKVQFEFSLMAVAEEVHAILKALPQ